MYDANFIQQLKQSNTSKDAEKTMARVKQLWSAASSIDKRTVEELAGVAKTTVYRIYNTGSISAKLAVPIAQVLNVNPFYLTGEADEAGECSDELLREYLSSRGYDKQLAEAEKAKPGKRRKPADAAVVMPEVVEEESPAQAETEEEISIRFDAEMRKALDDEAMAISQEEAVAPKPNTDFTNTKTVVFMDSLTEDDMILLMRSIILRAKSGMPDAVERAEALKRVLIS